MQPIFFWLALHAQTKKKHGCAAPPEPTQYIVRLPPAAQKTKWLGTIWPGSRIYNHFATGLAFLHLGGDNTQAYVGICRYGGNENLNSCCNDADNDCNGLVSCRGRAGAPARCAVQVELAAASI